MTCREPILTSDAPACDVDFLAEWLFPISCLPKADNPKPAQLWTGKLVLVRSTYRLACCFFKIGSVEPIGQMKRDINHKGRDDDQFECD